MKFVKNPAVFFAFLCVLLSGNCSARINAQESILSSYEKNFIKASLAVKAGILKDAAMDEKSGEFIGALSRLALEFALENAEILRDDSDMIALVGSAARGAAAGGQGGAENPAPLKTLWELFKVYQDSYSRVEIINALAVLGKGNRELTENLNKFLEDENSSFRAGVSRDFPVVRACIAALGILGDSSSFPVLFSAMTRGYPQALTQETLKALESIQGNYKDYLIDVIRKNPFPEKAAAFRIGAYNEKLDPAERGELAQTALEVSLDTPAENSGSLEASLRYDAVTVLTRLKWIPASSLAVRNFYRVQTDYANAAVPKERLLEAAACLGVMDSSEAAQALALQLGYLNSQTERSGEYDEELILAIINALGELGDKAAFDYLLYISYLNYPDKIQASARDALNRLKW